MPALVLELGLVLGLVLELVKTGQAWTMNMLLWLLRDHSYAMFQVSSLD